MYEDAAKWISTKNGLVENHAEGAYNNVMYGTMMSDCFKYSVHDKSVDGSFFYILFQPLGHIGERDGECLNSCEWILKIQSVGVRVDAAELHYL